MAAPHLSGVAAQVLQKYSSLIFMNSSSSVETLANIIKSDGSLNQITLSSDAIAALTTNLLLQIPQKFSVAPTVATTIIPSFIPTSAPTIIPTAVPSFARNNLFYRH
jgi:hypothetical protein